MVTLVRILPTFTGMALTHGDIIALLDSDDVRLPDRMATKLGLFEYCPEAEMLDGDATACGENQIKNRSAGYADQ